VNPFEKKKREESDRRGMVADLKLGLLDHYTRTRLLTYAEKGGWNGDYTTRTGMKVLIKLAKVLYRNMNDDEGQPGERLTNLGTLIRMWERWAA
jgi:hypothetical protein